MNICFMGSFTNTWNFRYLVYEYQRLTVWRSSFNSCFCVFYCLPVIIWNLCIYWLFTYNWFPQSLWFILLLVVCQDPINGKYLVSVIWYSSTIICWWLSWIAVTLKPEDRVLSLEPMKMPLRQRTKENDQVFRERLLTAKKLPKICLQ